MNIDAATFKVDGGSPVDLDTHIAELSWARLVRGDAGLHLECASADAERAIALLARAGACGLLVDRAPGAARDLVPAIMSDLGPVALPGAIDSVMLRPLDLGESTARMMRGSRSIMRLRRDDGRVRAILRAEDLVVAWRRVLWASPSALRSRALRGAHPVVFDRGAVERAAERFTLVRSGEVGRWARG